MLTQFSSSVFKVSFFRTFVDNIVQKAFLLITCGDMTEIYGAMLVTSTMPTFSSFLS